MLKRIHANDPIERTSWWPRATLSHGEPRYQNRRVWLKPSRMKLYTALFPSDTAIGTGDQLISRYELALVEDTHPVHLARFLLVFAITARQMPLHEKVRGNHMLRFVRVLN